MSTSKGHQLFSFLKPGNNSNCNSLTGSPKNNLNRPELSPESDIIMGVQRSGQVLQENLERNDLVQRLFVNEIEGYRLLESDESYEALRYLNRALGMRSEICHRGYGGGGSGGGSGYSPEMAKLHCSVGRAYADLGQFQDAHKNLRKGILIYERIQSKNRYGFEYNVYQISTELEEFVRNVLLADGAIRDESFRRFVEDREQRDLSSKQARFAFNQNEGNTSTGFQQCETDRTIHIEGPTVSLDSQVKQEQVTLIKSTIPKSSANRVDPTRPSKHSQINTQYEELEETEASTLSHFGELSTIGEEIDSTELLVRLELARVDLKLGLVKKSQDRLLLALEKSKLVGCEDEEHFWIVIQILELLGDIECDSNENYSAGRTYYRDALDLLVNEYGSQHEHHDIIFSKMLGIAGLF